MTITTQIDDNEWVAAAEGETYAASGFGATREDAALDLAEALESMLMAAQDDCAASNADRKHAWECYNTCLDERAGSFRMLQEAVGGCGLTEYQPEVDIEIKARIEQIVQERNEMRELLKEFRRSAFWGERYLGISPVLREKVNVLLKRVEG